ncbi:MAG: hypothetical protein CFH34_01720 [Alphaproteobacteria bacterium MarineAlpha9_Bin4]|nr:MAG: hypothetical protein CFH34_01720 [Alphaproteobacteria bacterium MarineAlpha9_Bin4]|tara:strand:+ start:226 stop:576 length:351 start_codon:yes stop_codon:yes gene_type:complete
MIIRKERLLNFFFIIIVILFNGCDSFKRFGQEKYTCSQNKLSIYQIDIIKTNSIKKAYMITDQGEVPLQIQNFSKKEISLSSKDLIININKKINEIKVSDENKIHFLKCKNETFNM